MFCCAIPNPHPPKRGDQLVNIVKILNRTFIRYPYKYTVSRDVIHKA